MACFTSAPMEVEVRLRHSRRQDPATIIPLGGGRVDIHMKHPARAPTPGQLAVFYNPEPTRQWAPLPNGTWRRLCDGVHAGTTPFGPLCRDALELPPRSVTILLAE